MGIISSTCQKYQSKKELNNFEKLKLTNEQVPFPDVYLPMNSYVVEDQNGFKLIKCCLTDINQSVFQIKEKLEQQMENTDNPYMITVHYVMEENHENRLKSIIPFNDHITCWFDMYKNTLEQKLQLNKELDENEIWKLIDTISHSLYQLQQKKRYQDSLGICTIYEVEAPFREHYYCVEDKFLQDQGKKQFNQWKLDYSQHKQLKDLYKCPPSPKNLELIKKNCFDKRDPYKDEVFTFGIVILQCFLGINIVDQIYDEKDLCIKQDLGELLLQIPQNFRGLLKEFLVIDETSRLDWDQINYMIDDVMEGKRLLDRYNANQFRYDFQNTEEVFNEINIKKQERLSKIMSPLKGFGQKSSLDQSMYSPQQHFEIQEDLQEEEKVHQVQLKVEKQNREQLLDKKLKEKQIEEYQKYQSRLIRLRTKQLQKKQQNYKPFQSQIHHYADENQYIEVYEKDKDLKKTQGTITYENGDVYIGDIHDKKKSGYGQIKDKQGNLIAHGKFKSDQYHGHCVIYNPKDKQKVSIFSPGHWDLTMSESNWDKYEGEFSHGLKQGQGKLYFSDGSVFEGKFKKDKVTTENGVYKYKNGEVITGKWFENIFTLY